MYALASLGLRRSAGGFCVAGAALGALQGVGCTPWRSLVSAALPVAFAWQARRLVLCQGSDVRPGVPWSPVAFAWQARHLVLCKGSDVRPGDLVSAALPVVFAWQAWRFVTPAFHLRCLRVFLAISYLLRIVFGCIVYGVIALAQSGKR